MAIIAYHRLLVKSSKSLINSEFIAACSPYADIGFHILLFRFRRLARAKLRERKLIISYNKMWQSRCCDICANIFLEDSIMKHNFEISYTQQGDYLLPDLRLPEQPKVEIGIWGKRHLRYIKQHHKIRYTNLLTSCKLTAYLADIDEQAEEMFFRLVKQLAEKEGVTEQLKADNQMLWVQRMNNIRNRATEIVNAELICTCSAQPPSGITSCLAAFSIANYLTLW